MQNRIAFSSRAISLWVGQETCVSPRTAVRGFKGCSRTARRSCAKGFPLSCGYTLSGELCELSLQFRSDEGAVQLIGRYRCCPRATERVEDEITLACTVAEEELKKLMQHQERIV